MEKELVKAHRNPPAGPRLPDPMTRDVGGIAKMAGAGVVGIAETMVAQVNKHIEEVEALAVAVRQEGEALIEALRAGSSKVEDSIRDFADLQAKVQLAFKQAGNDINTFGGKQA